MSLEPNNSEEIFVQQFARYEQDLRAFVRSMGLDWNAVDDVMQTVSLVMWRKWDQFDPDSSFVAWGRVIARFEVLKFRRSLARDRHVFQDDLMELLAVASMERTETISNDRYRECLDHCLTTLPEKSRELIQSAYRDDRTIKQMASDIGKSATALYKTLDRIRKQLQICIENKLHMIDGH